LKKNLNLEGSRQFEGLSVSGFTSLTFKTEPNTFRGKSFFKKKLFASKLELKSFDSIFYHTKKFIKCQENR